MSDLEDQFKPIAFQYGEVEADSEKSKYELEVNWPSVHTMLPAAPAKILDYGCGSGVYTRMLLAEGYKVLGVDNAKDMIAQMKDISQHAQVWTYQEAPLPNRFDAIIAKLVVQFIEDLPAFASAMKRQLITTGSIIISVPHPDKSRDFISDGSSIYLTEVGNSGLHVKMIHRELTDLKKVFEEVGFMLAVTDAPMVADESPKRLNIKFTLAG